MSTEDLDILLALVQINAAAGFLYVGLPAARYRNRLHDNIHRTLKEQFFNEGKDEENGENEEWDRDKYSEILREASFQSSHNYLSMWIGELSEFSARSVDEAITGFFASSVKLADTTVNQKLRQKLRAWWARTKPPLTYRWLKNDWDRRIVIASTFAPACFIGSNLVTGWELHQNWISISLVVGMIVLLGHLFFGKRMGEQAHTKVPRNTR